VEFGRSVDKGVPMVLEAADFKVKGADLAVDIAKQLLTLSWGGIAFAVGITTTDAKALHEDAFWWVIGMYGASTLLGFLFLMVGVSRYAKGIELKVYEGAARFLPLLQIILLVAGTWLLLNFHVEAATRKAGELETKLTVHQAGKDTVLSLQPGKAVTLTISSSGEMKAEVK
jgi:hypothetical protein